MNLDLVRSDTLAAGPAVAAGAGNGAGAGGLFSLILRNVVRQRSRTLLLGGLMVFASFVIVYFSQFLAGVHHNFSHNLVALATGDLYVASEVTREIDRNIFDRDYKFFRLTADLEEDLLQTPGLRSVTARLEFDTKVATAIDTVPFKAMAFDLRDDPQLAANFRFVEGGMFEAGSYGVVVPADFARRNRIEVGDPIRLVAKSLDKKVNVLFYDVTGIFETISLPAWFENYVYVDLAAARVLVDDPTAVTRVNLGLAPEAAPQSVRDGVRQVLARQPAAAEPALEVSFWEDGAQVFAELTAAMRLSYALIISIIVVMVATSLAFSTMLNIYERTREVATLAALGAAPGRIRLLLVGESLVLAAAAASAGLLCAALLYLLTAEFGIPIQNKELSGFLGSSRFYPAFDLSGWTAGLLVPLAVALLASYFFARRASNLNIAEALAEG